MSLSSAENKLLVSACTNMNIAANTCREVLEMLRGLGNTGAVDIATHNNSDSAHSSSQTLVHCTTTETGTKTIVDLGGVVLSDQRAYTLTASPTLISQTSRIFSGGRSSSLYNYSYKNVYTFLSDAYNNRETFGSTSLVGPYCIHYDQHVLYDADGKYVRSGWNYNSNRTHSLYNEDSAMYAQASILPSVTSGTYSQFVQPFEISGRGIVPTSTNSIDLGTAQSVFRNIYVANSPTVTSDRRIKTEIKALDAGAVAFIKSLHPVSYKFVQGDGQLDQFDENGNSMPKEADRPGIRAHWGFVAQEVKAAMELAGIEDAAVWCLADKNDPDSRQSLRYEELIAPLVKAVQVLAAKVEALEAR